MTVASPGRRAPVPTDAGHWEGDLIVGPYLPSAIGTLVERQTRYVKLLHLTGRDSAAHVDSLAGLPPSLCPSLTWDQGNEMARHLDIARDIGIKVYFCDAASPRQRGSNENTNGLLRQYLPKSTDLSCHGPRDLARGENELNGWPRITLCDEAPADLSRRLVA